MNCPNCQTPTDLNQKFCRNCGTNLQFITKPLTENVTSAVREEMKPSLNKWRRILPVWGLVIMFLGLMLSVTSAMLHMDKLVTLSGVLTTIIGMFCIGLPSVFPLTRNSSSPKKLSPSQTNQILPPESQTDYVPSITERTTNLLDYSIPVEAKRQASGELRP